MTDLLTLTDATSCPFCGWRSISYSDDDPDGCFLVCDTCAAQGPFIEYNHEDPEVPWSGAEDRTFVQLRDAAVRAWNEQKERLAWRGMLVAALRRNGISAPDDLTLDQARDLVERVAPGDPEYWSGRA